MDDRVGMLSYETLALAMQEQARECVAFDYVEGDDYALWVLCALAERLHLDNLAAALRSAADDVCAMTPDDLAALLPHRYRLLGCDP